MTNDATSLLQSIETLNNELECYIHDDELSQDELDDVNVAVEDFLNDATPIVDRNDELQVDDSMGEDLDELMEQLEKSVDWLNSQEDVDHTLVRRLTDMFRDVLDCEYFDVC